MNIETHTYRTSPIVLIMLVLALCSFSLYIILGLQDSARIYSGVQKMLSTDSLRSVTFPGSEKPLTISSWTLFHQGELWSLVSTSSLLDPEFVPSKLVNIPIAHGDSRLPMKIHPRISDKLVSLEAAAKQAGHSLMVSSAYRSIRDQQTLYKQFAAAQGDVAAARYVADPRASEHHTGLAIDFSSSSSSCQLDSDTCSLDMGASEWLASNAYRYGFILRYPESKQPITGIAYEPWHYRYVGIPLAKHIHQSDLTLDEALAQMYPAFAI